MQTKEQIEQQVWEYIDGSCNEAERARIALLIEQDAAWGSTYCELQALHSGIAGATELETPHVRFTKNVMEAIAVAHPAPPRKQYINKFIIKGIAAFFVLTIVAVVAFTLLSIDWSDQESLAHQSALTYVHYKDIFSPTFFNAMIGLNVVMVLVLADTMLRYRRRLRH